MKWTTGTPYSARGLRRWLSVALASFIIAAVTTGLATGDGLRERDDDDHDDGRGVYAIGLWGDLPYSDLQAQTGVPNLIADMNRPHLPFRAHDGDLKGGNSTPNSVTPTTCADALYMQALGFFNSLRAPAIFTPGDNDWTDCDRPSNGGFSSRERLDHERELFFNTPFSLGRRRLRQHVQTEPLCLGVNGFVPCVENRRWTLGGVTYATLNIQGSCNNLCDTAPDPPEYAARNAANIAWMQATFYAAQTRRSAAIMFITQGNPGWDLSDGTRAPLRDPKTLLQTDGQPDGYHDFLVALRDDRLPEADRLRAWRLALLPSRQAVPGLRRPPHRELHPRRDLWR